MSGFVGLAPMVRIRIHNSALGAVYPSRGTVEAVVDTGYQGFLLVPREVFRALSLEEMMTRTRRIEVADGRLVSSKVAFATVELKDAQREIDGPVETMEGLAEVLVGVGLLSRFRLTLDYCLKVFSIRPCE